MARSDPGGRVIRKSVGDCPAPAEMSLIKDKPGG